MVPQLEQLIKTKMDEGLREKVDLTTEIDTFNDLTALGLKAAIGGAMERLDVSFRAMSSKNWAHDAQVGEESAHVLQMGVVLTDFVPKIREFLSSSYFNTFCTRLATEMLQRYICYCYSNYILLCLP